MNVLSDQSVEDASSRSQSGRNFRGRFDADSMQQVPYQVSHLRPSHWPKVKWTIHCQVAFVDYPNKLDQKGVKSYHIYKMTRNISFRAFVRASVPILLFLNVIIHDKTTQAQRSLNHWKRDLEHRLKLYQDQQNAINNIASSSIYPSSPSGARSLYNGPVRISSNGNVRFSDLIIPVGSLKLSNHVAPSTVRILIDKTQAYVNSKINELYQIESQLETIHRQLDDPANQYIYKSTRGVPQPRRNLTGFIGGTRVFKQPQYVRFIESQNITLRRINNTDVNRVIDDTYLRNLNIGVFDSQGRLFIEGRKTFWDTVFSRPLQSGCCDRLKPLHTGRMMLRSVDQDVQAPVLLHARDMPYGQTAKIGVLSTRQFYNKIIALDLRPNLRPGETGLLPSPPPENFIQLQNLIDIHTPNQPQILKTIVFKTPVVIDEALLANSYVDNRLVIGVASMPGFAFDLSHDNYLLRYATLPKNYSSPAQVISGTLVLDAPTSFLAGVDAQTVNHIGDFARFVQESIVNINRPSTIRGPIQFNALPAMLNRENSISRPMQNIQILHAYRDLEVGLVNGVRVPSDLVILPMPGRDYNSRLALKPGQEIRVRGSRHFANRATFFSLRVNGLVNGLSLPDGVIPLHLNDFMHNVGHSNLRFLDGITVNQMTVQSAQFDEINLRDVGGDAQSVVIRSMSAVQPDGSILIRAPLRVMNLKLINSGPNRGLLNGFRPEEVIELTANNPYEILYGRKKFMAPVEAADCIFNDINQVANWTNHLIRIDRPATVQTVHTQLAFTSPQQALPYTAANQSAAVAGVNIDRLNVDFYPDSDKANHDSNWNFSPEFYLLHQALMRNLANYTGGRYRVDEMRLIHPSGGLVNQIPLGDIVTLDKPFRFADTFTLVGKVEVRGTVRAEHIKSTYPIDVMDLVQFNKLRIPIMGTVRKPIDLSNLVLGPDNRASFVQCRMLNGIHFSDFAKSIMSLTRSQDVYSNLVFQSPVSFEGPARTKASLNGIKNFEQFARSLKQAKYSFEEGLQCNSVVVRT